MPVPGEGDGTLSGQEVWDLLLARWQVSYDLQLVQRRGRIYLQVMWAYLEQQSFPLSQEGYLLKLEELSGLLNGLGVAGQIGDKLGRGGHGRGGHGQWPSCRFPPLPLQF